MRERGSGDRLVVLVHGVLDRGASFDAVVDLLATDCRVVTYDRRGYGSATDAPGSPAPLAVHVEDLLAIVDGRRAVVAGHSFGGLPALGAAARAPDVVEAVVAYETGLAWVPGWDDTTMRAVLTADDPERAGLRLMLGDALDGLGDRTLERRRSQARAFVTEERSIRTGDPPFDLAAIGAPVVYGRSDATFLVAVVDALRSSVADLEVVDVAGAGHHAHRDAPASFAALVRRALAVSA